MNFTITKRIIEEIEPKKYKLVDKLNTEITDLYDDLSYENTDKEIEVINKKITFKECLICKILENGKK